MFKPTRLFLESATVIFVISTFWHFIWMIFSPVFHKIRFGLECFPTNPTIILCKSLCSGGFTITWVMHVPAYTCREVTFSLYEKFACSDEFWMLVFPVTHQVTLVGISFRTYVAWVWMKNWFLRLLWIILIMCISSMPLIPYNAFR